MRSLLGETLIFLIFVLIRINVIIFLQRGKTDSPIGALIILHVACVVTHGLVGSYLVFLDPLAVTYVVYLVCLENLGLAFD